MHFFFFFNGSKYAYLKSIKNERVEQKIRSHYGGDYTKN